MPYARPAITGKPPAKTLKLSEVFISWLRNPAGTRTREATRYTAQATKAETLHQKTKRMKSNAPSGTGRLRATLQHTNSVPKDAHTTDAMITPKVIFHRYHNARSGAPGPRVGAERARRQTAGLPPANRGRVGRVAASPLLKRICLSDPKQAVLTRTTS